MNEWTKEEEKFLIDNYLNMTDACGIWTACGCFYVIEKEIDINKDNHTENDKNV